MAFIIFFTKLMFQISTKEVSKGRDASLCAVVTVFSKGYGRSIVWCFTPFSFPFCKNLCMRAMQFRGAVFKENAFIFYTVSFAPKADKLRYFPTPTAVVAHDLFGGGKAVWCPVLISTIVRRRDTVNDTLNIHISVIYLADISKKFVGRKPQYIVQ